MEVQLPKRPWPVSIRYSGSIPRIRRVILLVVSSISNMSQSYFRETGLPPVLCTLLQFPPNIQYNDPAPQEFALQFWDQQKLSNASYVVAILGMLVGSKGNSVSLIAALLLTTLIKLFRCYRNRKPLCSHAA